MKFKSYQADFFTIPVRGIPSEWGTRGEGERQKPYLREVNQEICLLPQPAKAGRCDGEDVDTCPPFPFAHLLVTLARGDK